MTWTCPYGGCDAYGYCPCEEDEDELQALEEAALCGELFRNPTVRSVETVPISIDNYEPPGT